MDNIELIKKFDNSSLWVATHSDGSLIYSLSDFQEPQEGSWGSWEGLRHMLACKHGQIEMYPDEVELPIIYNFLKEFTGNPDIKRAADCLAYGRKCRKRGMLQTALEYEAKGEKMLSKAVGYTISDALLTAWETTMGQQHPKELNDWSDFL